MILISIVIGLSLEMFTSQVSAFRHYAWADKYILWVKKVFQGKALWNGPWGVLLVLAFPLILVALVQTGLHVIWLGLLELIFSLIVLLYCMRYQPMGDDVEDLSHALEQGNNSEAGQLSEKILGKPVDEEQCQVQQVCHALLINVNERLIAVIVWFALLGPMGALLYRLSWYYSEESIHSENGFRHTMHRLHALLNWLPARLLVVGYAIVGSFEDAIHGWRGVYKNPPEDMEALNQAIITAAGCSALHLERYSHSDVSNDTNKLDIKAIDAAHGLVLRTLLAWGIVMALLTLAGWMG